MIRRSCLLISLQGFHLVQVTQRQSLFAGSAVVFGNQVFLLRPDRTKVEMNGCKRVNRIRGLIENTKNRLKRKLRLRAPADDSKGKGKYRSACQSGKAEKTWLCSHQGMKNRRYLLPRCLFDLNRISFQEPETVLCRNVGAFQYGIYRGQVLRY